MADKDFNDGDATLIDRTETGKRFLLTLFFAIVVRLLEVVLVVAVLFELAFTLITRRPPNDRVTRFAHRILCYAFEVGQYMTYNKEELPFPFEELPNGTEPMDMGSAATT
jgi:hypothetical protein